MAVTYGVLSTGFYPKPLATIDNEVDADLQAILGASAGTDSDGKIPTASMAGQLKALIVDAVAAQWDLQQAVVASMDPNQATGASQDAVGSITGIIRDAAEFSTVTVTCTGSPSTILLAGRVTTVTDSGSRFLSRADATIAAATLWLINTPYIVGDRRSNSNRIYQCITAGTSAGATGPTTTSSDITDNTAHWKYLGEGTGVVDVTFDAETAGAIGAIAGLLVTIGTPVSGWRTAVNLADGIPGRTLESDSAFRVRRDNDLAAPGNTTVDAIRANILAVNQGSTDPAHEPPTTCDVFFNDTDYVDANGMPPHSVEVVVDGGTAADIAKEVWNSVGGGTAMYGNRTDTITDSQGNSQSVTWTQPVDVPVYVTATGYFRASDWPTGSETLVAQTMLSALLTYCQTYYTANMDVRTSALNGAFMRGPAQTSSSGSAVVPAATGSSAVPGLLEVTPIYIGTSASPSTSTNIVITRRQIATFDSTHCVITAVIEGV